MQRDDKPLSVFTWHVHGSYLYYLSQGPFTLYVPVKEHQEEGYYGRGLTHTFGENVVEIPVSCVQDYDFDLILFQSSNNYLKDQYEILSSRQRKLPRIYLEHNTPHGPCAQSEHWVDDPEILLVHVTHFNELMWNNNHTVTTVIPHGVEDHGANYVGNLDRGLVIQHHLRDQGRVFGDDLYEQMRRRLPLDLVGRGNYPDGLGEISHSDLPMFRGQYRFLFHPARNSSLSLSVCESMMQGIPVIALATTEMATTITNGVDGFIHTDIEYLYEQMARLLENRALAKDIGAEGRKTALLKFGIQRFITDWQFVFRRQIHDAALLHKSLIFI